MNKNYYFVCSKIFNKIIKNKYLLNESNNQFYMKLKTTI